MTWRTTKYRPCSLRGATSLRESARCWHPAQAARATSCSSRRGPRGAARGGLAKARREGRSGTSRSDTRDRPRPRGSRGSQRRGMPQPRCTIPTSADRPPLPLSVPIPTTTNIRGTATPTITTPGTRTTSPRATRAATTRDIPRARDGTPPRIPVVLTRGIRRARGGTPSTRAVTSSTPLLQDRRRGVRLPQARPTTITIATGVTPTPIPTPLGPQARRAPLVAGEAPSPTPVALGARTGRLSSHKTASPDPSTPPCRRGLSGAWTTWRNPCRACCTDPASRGSRGLMAPLIPLLQEDRRHRPTILPAATTIRAATTSRAATTTMPPPLGHTGTITMAACRLLTILDTLDTIPTPLAHPARP
mmetsp:Transcript_30899/g.65767  ORF Transcript_30899/g.65767 Transcript_30899/m.65767 type:complete len:362 (-) Transcript_30899:2360-3445(-)